MVRTPLVALFAATLALPTAAAQASVKVTWPEQRTYAPGESLTVKVASDKAVRVALVRESASGKVMRTIVRKTLRKGTFKAAVPAAGRYALRVAERSRTLTVVAPPAPPAAPPAKPTSWWLGNDVALPPGFDCAPPTAGTVELRLAAVTVQRGTPLAYELFNPTAGCLTVGEGYQFERKLPDATWEPIDLHRPFSVVGILLRSGTGYSKSADVPVELEPGTYRLLDAGVAAEFEVTA